VCPPSCQGGPGTISYRRPFFSLARRGGAVILAAAAEVRVSALPARTSGRTGLARPPEVVTRRAHVVRGEPSPGGANSGSDFRSESGQNYVEATLVISRAPEIAAAAAAAVDTQIALAVQRLGSDDFDEREKASRLLHDLGRMSLAKVQKALATATEAEVKSRLEAVIQLLKEDVEAAYSRRVEQILKLLPANVRPDIGVKAREEDGAFPDRLNRELKKIPPPPPPKPKEET
jgi:hypothetical protein